MRSESEEDFFDILSTLLATVGIILVMANKDLSIIDPIMSIGVAVIMIVLSVRLTIINISLLLDKSYDPKTIENIKQTIDDFKEVENVTYIKSREFGSRVFIDVEISLKSSMTIKEGRKIIEKIDEVIYNKFPEVKEINISINPFDE